MQNTALDFSGFYLSPILQIMDHAVFVFDESFILLHVNEKAMALLDKNSGGVDGNGCQALFSTGHPGGIVDKLGKALESGEEILCTLTLKFNGKPIPYDASILPLYDQFHSRTHLYLIIFDNAKNAFPKPAPQASGLPDKTSHSLRALLEQASTELNQMKTDYAQNIKSLISPYVEKLRRSSLDADQATIVSLLEENLKKFLDPFHTKLTSQMVVLTPVEMQVACMIRDGKTNKEIAQFLNLSVSTVLTHSHHIRKKLELKHKKINLRSYLQSIA
jgi:DNA-binding CsgD family transcriptional regulator